MVTKLYCFVDETGQDTEGKLFLVAVVLKEQEHIMSIQNKLEKIEKSTKKNLLKWTKTPFKVSKHYLDELMRLKELKEAIFYSTYHNTKSYTVLTAQTIAKAVFARKVDDYRVNIIIDGLNKKEMEKVRKELKKLKVHYKKIKGMRDEQNVFLRLADAIAGFLRDYVEKQTYTKFLFRKFKEQKMIVET